MQYCSGRTLREKFFMQNSNQPLTAKLPRTLGRDDPAAEDI